MTEDTSDETEPPRALDDVDHDSEDQDWVELPSADALTELGAQRVLFQHACSRVLLVGAVASGKTSILTAIYERLCRGNLDDWSFGFSSTIIGFEKRCWEGRTNSGGHRDQIGRTSLQSDDYLLHLDVVHTPGLRQHVLIADLSGEVFRELKVHPAAAGELPVLQSCDHLAIVVDGARLGTPAERQIAINDGLACLRACVAFGRLQNGTNVELVIAKWDLAVSAGLTEEWANEHVFNTLEDELEQTSLTSHRFVTASRPTSGDFVLGSGVAPLLSAWAEPRRRPPFARTQLSQDVRQYLRYGG